MSERFFEAFSTPVWQQIAVALVHFAWQAVAVVLLVAAALSLVSPKNAALRFRLGLLGMVLLVLCPLATWLFVRQPPAAPSPTVSQSFERSVSLDSLASREADVHRQIGADTVLPPADIDSDTIRDSDLTAFVPSNSGHAKTEIPELASRWQPYVVAAWLAGVCFLSLRLLFSSLSTQWLVNGRRSLPADVEQRLAELARRMRVPRACAYVSTRVGQAMVVGILRPCILMPASWLTQLTPEMLEAVLAHELAHLRRRDLWAVLFQRLVETLFFYHPAVWWLSRRIDVEREMACDDSAVAATGQRLLYAQSLERVARGPLAGVRPSLAATIQGERKMKLLRRVRHVLDADPKAGKGRWWPVGLLVLLVALGVWGATTDAFTGSKTALADDEGERREGEEREVRREGDRERGEQEREIRREGYGERGEREVRRDGDREREGNREREGDRPVRRDGDRAREGFRRDGDRREGDRPREGDRERPGPRFEGPPPTPRERAMLQMIEQLRREIHMLREEVHRMRGGRPPIPREGDRPQFRRDGDGPDVRRDGDRPRFRREGDRPDVRRDGDRPQSRPDADRPRVRREGDRPDVRRDGDRREGEQINRRDGEGDRKRDEDREEGRRDGDER